MNKRINHSTPACTLCSEPENDQMVQCDKCDLWTHYTCQNYSSQIAEQMLVKYYCMTCRQTHDLINKWKLKKPSAIKQKEKKDFYFDVEAIVDHKERQGVREFLIKWENYSTLNWEPEKNLDGCLDLLQAYCETQKIPFSRIEGVLGAELNLEGLNDRNWVQPSSILHAFQSYMKQRRVNTLLNIQIWDQKPERDSLIFVPHKGHCYVVLYYASKNLGYIADGSNYFIRDEAIAQELNDKLGFYLSPRRYDQQAKVDHCGSSAVMIAIELTKHYRLNLKPDIIVSSKRQHERLKKCFHTEPSLHIPGKPIHKFLAKLECDSCGKKFKSNNQKGYKSHIKTHKSS